jgi:3-oxoacyl-[acyl-carrier protein] reductase
VDLHLRGKNALVTGGSRGIGRAIALRLAQEGCGVAVCGRTSQTLQSVKAELAAFGEPVHCTVADVTKAGETERFVEEAGRALGGVDMVVANVGGASSWSFMEAAADDWVQTFEMNLFHAVRLIRAAVPWMQERGGGSAVTISSISGWRAGPGAPYGTSKAAEIFLSGALAWELAPYRIRVNTVSPGSIIFPGGSWDGFRSREPERFAKFEQEEFPWGRLGSADEVADVVAFVLSDRAQWVNGANIPVDGGQGHAGAR